MADPVTPSVKDTSDNKPSISVVFPMYNEEANIRFVVDLTLEELGGVSNDYEIVIVDDASTDRTGVIADELARQDPHIKVIHHPENRKLGAAIKTGYANATKDLILYSDADLPFDIRELKKALRILRIKKADIVAAYRLDRSSEGIVRTVYSFVYNMLVSLSFSVNFRDINFSFKLFKREVLERVKLESEGSFIDAEFMIKSYREGFVIVQFGTDYFVRTRGISTLSRPVVILNILAELLRFRFKLWLKR